MSSCKHNHLSALSPPFLATAISGLGTPQLCTTALFYEGLLQLVPFMLRHLTLCYSSALAQKPSKSQQKLSERPAPSDMACPACPTATPSRPTPTPPRPTCRGCVQKTAASPRPPVPSAVDNEPGGESGSYKHQAHDVPEQPGWCQTSFYSISAWCKWEQPFGARSPPSTGM